MSTTMESFILKELRKDRKEDKFMISIDDIRELANKLSTESFLSTDLITTHPMVKSLQHKVDRVQNELMVARAKFYDILYKNEQEPDNTELKAEIVYLRDELKKTIEKRDSLKEEIAALKFRLSK